MFPHHALVGGADGGEQRHLARPNHRLEFELGAWFEGACGFALVLALSQMMEHGLGPFGRAGLHPRRNPLDRQGRFAPQPSKFPLLTLLDAPDFTRLATGNPKAGRPWHPGAAEAVETPDASLSRARDTPRTGVLRARRLDHAPEL